ncbi:MAG: gamma-glutamyltransferase, partial [Planctomycetes bacterium]|nr:gamma-glutamyltransferase [Planctomycetota bacterium]
MVQGVVDPHMCGIGGYLIANGSFSDNQETDRSNIVDAPAVAGSRVSDEMWEDQVIRPNPDGWGFFLKGQVNDIGYQSMCVPGAVRGLDSLLRERGTISWSEALKPAIRIAREGFVVGTTLSDLWKARRKYPEEVSFLDR